MHRLLVARWANDVGRLSRRRGAPTVYTHSPREIVLEWLQWNDPNACYLDVLSRAEDLKPLDLEEAWALLAAEAVDDTTASTLPSEREHPS